MGAIIATGGMLMSQRHARAAIAVYDAANVEQAIKTAVQTATILSETQKQLALEILNTKRLDFGVLGSIALQHAKAETGFLSGDATLDPEQLKAAGKSVGMLNSGTTAVNILTNEIGTVEDVLNNSKTLVDGVLDTQKNLKAMDATLLDAAQTANNSQTVSNELSNGVKQAVEAANNAEGQLQVQQAQAQILAAQYYETRNTNNLLASLLAAETQKAYVENREQAVGIRLNEEVGNGLKSWADTLGQK